MVLGPVQGLVGRTKAAARYNMELQEHLQDVDPQMEASLKAWRFRTVVYRVFIEARDCRQIPYTLNPKSQRAFGF